MSLRRLIEKIHSAIPRRKQNGVIKIVLVGNCQSRPLAQLLTLLNPSIQITAVAVVHLLKSEQADEYIPFFDEADFIVAQLVADNYPCDFVRTNILKRAYGAKVVSIVNLYYSGYNPEIMYVRGQDSKPLAGPLDVYHNKTFLDSWKEGTSVEEALQRNCDFEYNLNKYSSAASDSLLELKKRELLCDINITDFIEKNLGHQRLFFTFNHPCLNLMLELAERVLEKIEVKIFPLDDGGKVLLGEPLDKIMVPINVYTKKTLGISFEDINACKGVAWDWKGNNTGIRAMQHYSLIELVDLFFKVYDANF